jgi:hypothetical protein
MKRFNKVVMMVMVLMVMVMLSGACKKADIDPIEQQDDVQFVSVNSVITARYDGFANVTTTFVFRVKTFASTSIEGEAYVLARTRPIGAGGINTGGQWSEIPIVVNTQPYFGTYDISGYVILKSTGKRVDIPTSQFTVQ